MKDRKKIGKNNRNKGHSFERELAKKLKIIFPEVMTSRAGDRSRDNQKIDLLNTMPFNFQCKCSINFPNPVKIFKEMPADTNYNILAVKIKNKGNYITMSEETFLDILGILKINGTI